MAVSSSLEGAPGPQPDTLSVPLQVRRIESQQVDATAAQIAIQGELVAHLPHIPTERPPAEERSLARHVRDAGDFIIEVHGLDPRCRDSAPYSQEDGEALFEQV